MRIFCPEPMCGWHDELPCGHPVPALTDEQLDRAEARLRRELGWKLGWTDYRAIARAMLTDALEANP